MRTIASLFPGRGTASGMALILFGLMTQPFAAPVLAGDNKGAQVPDEASSNDWRLNEFARRAILKDTQLSEHSIGVSVQGKVATIWGSIPSLDIAKRAEQDILKVPGIIRVVNECQIVQARDPVPDALAEAVKKARDQNGGSSYARHAPPPAASTAARQLVAKPGPDFIPPKPSDLVQPSSRSGSNVTLLPPEPGPAPMGSDANPETIRRSDKRYKDLTLESKDGVLKINGVVVRMKDAWELAELLNRAPGVKQVIIGKIVEK